MPLPTHGHDEFCFIQNGARLNKHYYSSPVCQMHSQRLLCVLYGLFSAITCFVHIFNERLHTLIYL